MKTYKKLSFSEKIQWRIRGLWILLAGMLIYMVVVGELGWGDSRVITQFANTAGTLMFFGGLGWVIYKISKNKKLLKNPYLLKEQMKSESDERNQYLHGKSGGIVWDILFVVLLFVTMTASLINMPVFYTSWALLVIAVVLKVLTYFWYRSNT